MTWKRSCTDHRAADFLTDLRYRMVQVAEGGGRASTLKARSGTPSACNCSAFRAAGTNATSTSEVARFTTGWNCCTNASRICASDCVVSFLNCLTIGRVELPAATIHRHYDPSRLAGVDAAARSSQFSRNISRSILRSAAPRDARLAAIRACPIQ